MKIIFSAICFVLVCNYSFSQTSTTKSKCSYYSISDSSKAQIKITDNGKALLSFYLGRIPSITIDKKEKRVIIEVLTDKPFGNSKPSPVDSLIFSLVPFQTTSIAYNIHSEIDQNKLKKDGYDFGYLLTPKSHELAPKSFAANAVLLFKAKANTIIFDVVLMLQTEEEDILVTSSFLVGEDCN